MQQLKLIQDWSYNYIYLCCDHASTQMDLKHHSYKDVINTFMQDMVSIVANEDSIPSWLIQNEPIWMCDHEKDCELERSSSSSNYIAEPFPEHELEPHGWHDILATLDVCAQVHAIAHCDDEGYDIQSINMVQVLKDHKTDNTFEGILGELSPSEVSYQIQK